MDGFSKQKEKLTKDLKASTVEHKSKLKAIKAEYIEESDRLRKNFQSQHLQKELAHQNHVQQLTDMLKENEQQMTTSLKEEFEQIGTLLQPQMAPVARAPMALATIALPRVVARPEMALGLQIRPNFGAQGTLFSHPC